VAGTGSSKPYLFNADNVARYAPAAWHSPGSVIDQSYEALDRLARQPIRRSRTEHDVPNQGALIEPSLSAEPPIDLGWAQPDAAAVAGREVWLVHPWNLDDLPTSLSANTVVVGVLITDFHRAWPWSERRWRFVASRMAQLAPMRWQGDAAALGAALQGASRVRSVYDPHIAQWLATLAACEPEIKLFPEVARRCDSFSQWWTRASRGFATASELLAARQAPAW
jgi:deoxyribodipyrimidine photo-lyase